MVAAKVRSDGSDRWYAWLGVNLDHIQRDAGETGWFSVETLQEISLQEASQLETYPHAMEVVQAAERRYRGQEIPYRRGTTAYSLGVLAPAPV